MSSGLPSGKKTQDRVDDFGLGPYDSENPVHIDSEPTDPNTALPSPGEPERTYDFYGSSQLPEDDDQPTARSDYFDSLYVGQRAQDVENLEIQDNDLFGYHIEDLLDNTSPEDPYEAGVLSSVISALFESSAWTDEPRVRVCAADLHSVVRVLRRRS